MLTRFDLYKTIQAAAVLLKTTDGKRMSRLRLVKLLYIADRESIAETEVPITGDSVVAMKHGPVLSQTYNLIKGETFAAHDWERYFRSSGQDVELEVDPGFERLSRYDIRKLRTVAERFRDENEWDIVEHTHQFPEWLENYVEGTSRPISATDVLEALGMSEDAPEILAEAKSRRQVDRALARVR